jgi:hypothetical protein
MKKIHTNTQHTFGIDHKEKDSMTGNRPLARGFCYPQSEWFSLTLGRSKDGEHITWEEWDQIVLHVAELREASQMIVTLNPLTP